MYFGVSWSRSDSKNPCTSALSNQQEESLFTTHMQNHSQSEFESSVISRGNMSQRASDWLILNAIRGLFDGLF